MKYLIHHILESENQNSQRGREQFQIPVCYSCIYDFMSMFSFQWGAVVACVSTPNTQNPRLFFFKAIFRAIEKRCVVVVGHILPILAAKLISGDWDVCLSVDPPLWSKLKHLNKLLDGLPWNSGQKCKTFLCGPEWTASKNILHRFSWKLMLIHVHLRMNINHKWLYNVNAMFLLFASQSSQWKI